MTTPSNRGTKTHVNDTAGTILENVIARNDQGVALGSAASPVAVNVATWIGSAAPTVGQKAMAASLPVVLASDQSGIQLSSIQGKTAIAATAVVTTAGVVKTQIVSYARTLTMMYLQHFSIQAYITTPPAIPATTGTLLGLVTLEAPFGTILWQAELIQANDGVAARVDVNFSEPFMLFGAAPPTGSPQVRLTCTPAAATGMTWIGNLIGYEK